MLPAFQKLILIQMTAIFFPLPKMLGDSGEGKHIYTFCFERQKGREKIDKNFKPPF